MKIRKIVDTVAVYGQAENYIDLNISFLKFLRDQYKIIPKDLTAEEITKKYNLRGVAFGNYVTQEERFFFLYKADKQLEVISKLKGSKDLGFGVLTLAFGVEGSPRANAHINPRKLLINLNRGRKGDYTSHLKGEGSLVHEWGHFLDLIIGFSYGVAGFASNSANLRSQKSSTRSDSFYMINQIVDNVIKDDRYMTELSRYNNAEYLRKRIEIFARLFEKTIEIIVHTEDRFKEYRPYFERLNQYEKSYYYPTDKIKKDFIKPIKELLKNFKIKDFKLK